MWVCDCYHRDWHGVRTYATDRAPRGAYVLAVRYI
jgi:hypothetical protein